MPYSVSDSAMLYIIGQAKIPSHRFIYPKSTQIAPQPKTIATAFMECL